jgi:hypothetical protein
VLGQHGSPVLFLFCLGENHSNQKDVKNADRSGDVYDNKGSHDKMSSGFCKFHGHFVQSCRILPVCEAKKVQDARRNRVCDEFFSLPWGRG